MKTLKRKEVLNKLQQQKDQFFTVKFIKKDGSIRKMNCRLGVHKDLKGVGLRYNPIERGLLCVRDVQKKAYRMINLKTVIDITAGGETWVVV